MAAPFRALSCAGPRRSGRRDWYKRRAADPIDHSHPDVGDDDRPHAARVGLHVRTPDMHTPRTKPEGVGAGM